MKAIKVVSQGKAEIQDVAVPELRPSTVLVKVHCVALNPIDWMNVEYQPVSGATLGCDFSGTIEAVDDSVAKKWIKGDRVCGWVFGNNHLDKDVGAFAEYCLSDGELVMHVPDSMSDIEAAGPASGIATAGVGVFQKHDLHLPGEGDGKGEPILVRRVLGRDIQRC